MHKRKLIAIIIAAIYLAISALGGGEMFLRCILLLLTPLLLIFFNEEMGRFQGFFGGFPRPMINQESPAELVEFMGWIFLFLPIIIGAYSYLSVFM